MAFRKVSPSLQAPAGIDPGSYRSLGLLRIAEHLGRVDKPLVLDLGHPLQENLDYLSRFPARIFFEGLGDVLPILQTPPVADSDPDELPPDPFAGLFIYPGTVRFDLVLAWDFFDYLRPDQITELYRRLVPHLARDCLLFCLASSRPQIPASPQRYRVLGDDRLGYQTLGPERIPGPRHRALELQTRLGGFSPERSVLLQHGVQEYLFRYRG